MLLSRKVVSIASKHIKSTPLRSTLIQSRKAFFGFQSMKLSYQDAKGNLEFKTLAELQHHSSQVNGDKLALGTRVGNKYEWMTYKQFDVEVQKFRNVLKHHKIGFGDKVGIISNNRAEWAVCNYATVGLGAQFVPMYEAQLEKDWEYIVKDSEMKILLCSTDAVYQKAKNFVGKVGNVNSIICFEAPADQPYSYKGWMDKVSKEAPVPIDKNVTPDTLCTVIYTSGTTGNPKGVELSHNNIVTNVKDGRTSSSLTGDTSLAFLPWAHVYGLTVELHGMVCAGGQIGIVPHRDQILECLGLVQPTMIVSVPALFNRVYDGVLKNVSTQSPLKQKIFHWAMSVARERNHLLEFHQPVGGFLALKHNVADKLVLSKIRAKLGRLKRMMSGGAATGLPVLQFFEDIGIPVLAGYGLTETSPVISCSRDGWTHRRLGCVGVPMPSVDVKIIDPSTLQELPKDTEGEITCSGPSVMVGYRNNPKANEEVFFQLNGKRYFRTGDLGRLVEGRYLMITGRIKEQYKLENGKYVVPAPLEDVYSRSPYMLQTFIYGDNKKYNVALIVPNFPELTAWIQKQNNPELTKLIPDAATLKDTNTQSLELFKHPLFKELISKEIVRVGAGCKNYEKPHVWAPIVHPFTPDNHMQTPKLSLRRNNILKAYQHIIDKLYTPDGIKEEEEDFFHPDKANISNSSLAKFLRSPVSGNLREVPGVSDVCEKALRAAGVSTTFALIGKFFLLKEEGVGPVEHIDRFYYWLQSIGAPASNRASIVVSIAEKLNNTYVGIYDSEAYM